MRAPMLPSQTTPPRFLDAIGDTLRKSAAATLPVIGTDAVLTRHSVVLFMLGPFCGDSRRPCVMLNKRSQQVRQPGDLCFPGGGIEGIDRGISRLLTIPGMPMTRWPGWRWWRQQHPADSRHLALISATALREAFEEIRLLPVGVRLLGRLPPQSLVLFRRIIHPVVAWVSWQRRFFPNREVARIVYAPLDRLMDRNAHTRYRVRFRASENGDRPETVRDFPGVRIDTPEGCEILWGATHRMTMDFLRLVFEFLPPSPETLPVIHAELGDRYLGGSVSSAS